MLTPTLPSSKTYPRPIRRQSPKLVTLLLLTLLLAIAPWQTARAVLVTLIQQSSLTGVAAMTNGTSPVPSVGALDQLANDLGLAPGSFAYVDEVVRLVGGGMSATFASGTPPEYNTRVVDRPEFAPWEAINIDIPLAAPLRLVAQPPTAKGHQNALLWSDDYTSDGLPGQQWFLGGVLDGGTGGALSLLFDIGQFSFGFNVVQLDIDQPQDRYIYVNFYDSAGVLLDLLTIRVPKFPGTTTSKTGVAILYLSSTVPFFGLTVTTDDPVGFGAGDFRFVTTPLLPTSVLLWTGAALLFLLNAQRRYP